MSQGKVVRDWYRRTYAESTFRLPPRKGPYIRGDIEPYQSPVTGEVITSRREHREDLKRAGCRVYEGREQEEKEAARYREDQNRKDEKALSEAVEQTAAELKDGRAKKYRTIGTTGF